MNLRRLHAIRRSRGREAVPPPHPSLLGRCRLHAVGSGGGEVRPAAFTPSGPQPSPRRWIWRRCRCTSSLTQSGGGEGVAAPPAAAAQRETGRSGERVGEKWGS